MTYHRICNKNNTTGASDEAGSAHPSGTHDFILGLKWSVFFSTNNEALLLELKFCRGAICYGNSPSYNIREQVEK